MPKSKTSDARELIPERPTLRKVQRAAADCQACPLWKDATQTVFGEGPRKARVFFVGEQPGDKEDREGRPFVGPAGSMLQRAMETAGLDSGEAYITNVVKHFKFVVRGKNRIHKKPNRTEMVACRPWLDIELELVHPEVVVCLGATAAQALIGPSFRITRQRGQFVDAPIAPRVIATWHPSAVLRAPDREARHRQRQELVDDLRKVAKAVA